MRVQRVAVCCSADKCLAVTYHSHENTSLVHRSKEYVAVCCSAVLCVAICCSSDKRLLVRYRVAKTHRIPYLYRSFSASDLYLVALLWEMICNLGDAMSLRHPVPQSQKDCNCAPVKRVCVLVCCGVLQRSGACCSMLQCSRFALTYHRHKKTSLVHWSKECVAVCCSAVLRVAAPCCVLQYVAVLTNVLR